MKKRIGLVPKCRVGDPEQSCMLDYILVGHTYAQRIIETGCTPVPKEQIGLFFTN